MKRILWLIVFVMLTLLTQVGGIALILAWLCVRFAFGNRREGWARAGMLVATFGVVYAVLTVLVVPPLAALGGRVPLPCRVDPSHAFGAASPLYCVLNRNYVEPRLAALLAKLSGDIADAFPGTTTLYLDANFPFLDGFPLLPHLSHDDGLKLDLALYYADAGGAYLPAELRSPIGYLAFEQPATGEASPCDDGSWLTLRWSMTALQPHFRGLQIEPQRTRAALDWLFTTGAEFGIERVFVEPYLAARLGISSPLLGFQGCLAARHDDHIHLQIKP